MSDLAVGSANGVGFGRRQKPWSELISKSHRLPQEAAEPVKIGFESAFRNQTFAQHNTMDCDLRT